MLAAGLSHFLNVLALILQLPRGAALLWPRSARGEGRLREVRELPS